MWAKGTLAALILSITGGHWMILQSVAWTRMIVVYSRSSSLQTALGRTFDGRHPCGMCKLIQNAKRTSTQAALQQTPVKHDDWLAENQSFDFFRPPCAWTSGADDLTYASRADPPPDPPPRSVSRRS